MQHSFKGVVATLAVSAGLTASVMAEGVSTKPVFTKPGSGITVIPGDYLTDGHPQIVISDAIIDTDTIPRLRHYDMEFAELGEAIGSYERMEYYRAEYRSLDYSWPTVIKEKLAQDLPLTEMIYTIEHLYGSGYIETKESEGGTDIYLHNDRCVFDSWVVPEVGVEPEPGVGYMYKVWFRFEPYDAENPEGNGVLYGFEGAGDAPVVNPGEWVVLRSDVWKMSPFCQVGLISDKGSHTNCSLDLTQTLFNEDAKYEYISRDWESRLVSVGESTTKLGIPVGRYTKYDVVCYGFSVKKADGTTIQSVKFPEDFHGSGTLNFMVLELGDRRYLCCESYDEVIIYAIDGDGAGLRQVGSPVSARVFPTIVGRGEPLSIERDDASVEVRVSLYSGDGIRRYSGGMQAGERLKTLPTAGLPGGLNIVTIEDGSHSESTKIIVK